MLFRSISLAASLLSLGCLAGEPDEAANADDAPEGDSVDVASAGAIGVRVPTSLNLDRRGKFYLTFDDGPSGVHTPSILATLRAHRAPAVFFMTGANLAGNEAIVRDLDLRGHLVASHQWSRAVATIAQFRA